MKILSWLIISCFLVNSALADDAKYLEQGKPAPFTGYLITSEKAEKIRLMDIDLTTERRVNSALKDENAFLTQRLENSKTHIQHLQSEVARKDDFWVKTGYFIAGALVTGLIAYGTVRAIR